MNKQDVRKLALDAKINLGHSGISGVSVHVSNDPKTWASVYKEHSIYADDHFHYLADRRIYHRSDEHVILIKTRKYNDIVKYLTSIVLETR